MASKMIGIEIGSNTLKMVVCSGGVVKKAAVRRLPEDLVREGRVTAPAAMVSYLKTMMKENGIRPGACALVLPSQLVLAHRVTMPVMSEAELLLNLPFEFRDFVGKDGAKYHYDYSVMGTHDNIMELYAAAVRKDVVEEYYSILKKAGLTLKVATPPEMAWLNLVNSGANLPEKLCIVDLGHHTTRVSIFAGKNFVMGKTIEMGGALIDETIAANQQVDAFVARTRKEADMDKVLTCPACQDAYQALAIEVMKTLNFFSYTDSTEGGNLEHLYYCGGSSVIEPLRTALIKSTGMTLHHAHRLVKMGDNISDLALYCALAAGAAIQQQ